MESKGKKTDLEEVRLLTEKITKYYSKLIETIDVIQSSLKIEKDFQGEIVNSALLLNSVNLLVVYIGKSESISIIPRKVPRLPRFSGKFSAQKGQI